MTPAPRNRKRSPAALRRRRRWFVVLAAVPVTFIAVSVLLTLPLRWFDPATTAFMLQDDSGRDPLLHEWIEWDEMGAAIVLAVVAAEDQRFSVHFGIDFESIRKSIDSAGRGGRLRGASTITQQVAKNLYLWPGRSYLRKGIEAWFALLLETFLPKRRILQIYLNIAEFGPGIYGISAASRYYFGEPAIQLRDGEAALLAAVLPSPRRLQPHRPSDYVRERQRWILGQMQRLRREGWLATLD
ncbi:MAG: monofunctional biosynthetic peptidoglycan transglycosylase [Woeseiaceae bacterium]|nr:monofunctional biosynthetic peptidoglycan transglycosylase [Woeseiaceae bacterium]